MIQLKFITIIAILITSISCEQTITVEESWIFGFIVGIGISLMGFVAAILLVCIQRCISQHSFKTFVNMLYALGCGAIIGDAMIHILPQSYGSLQNDKHLVSLIFISAVVFFIIVERVFERCGIVHHHWGDDDHEHQHQHQHGELECDDHEHNVVAQANQEKYQQMDKQQKNQFLEDLKGKGAAGYLNLISSFIHNFFDGFAVGVGFASRDPHIFIPVVVAILAHQIPRQMGDVGILMKNGFTNNQTILCNGIINFMSLAGLFPGLALGGISQKAQNYVMTFVAGNFIYIGADIWRNLLKNRSNCQNIVQLFMFSVGVGAMYLVLFAEQDN